MGQGTPGPLEPPDRSSPRAALQSFFAAADAVALHVAEGMAQRPSAARAQRFEALLATVLDSLDLSELPPVVRRKSGGAAALALYETLARLELPPWDEIPGSPLAQPAGAPPFDRWVVPRTEILLVRRTDGARAGDWVFSADTVARADEFRSRVEALAYLRPMPMPLLREVLLHGGGWMVPYARIQALPDWLRRIAGGQPVWKWLALVVVTLGYAALLRAVSALANRLAGGRPVRRAVLRLALPATMLATLPGLEQALIEQVRLVSGLAAAVQTVLTGLMHVAGAWLAWRLAPLVAELFIASPRGAPDSVDAHLIRICSRLFGLVAAAGLLALGADRLGVPVYGIVAGLGVGGLAIALAAQPTIENLIGGFSLYADKPVRVGEFCRYGTDMGTVEEIGMRSTRIRGLDQTVTTVPNAVFSRMAITNFSRRGRILLNVRFGLRAGTEPAALRQVLARAEELLQTHPRLHPEAARVRLNGFAEGALEIEVFVYARTADWAEFLAIREEVWLRLLELVAGAGAEVVCPAQTVFLRPEAPSQAARAADAHEA